MTTDANEIYRLAGKGHLGIAMRMICSRKEELTYDLCQEVENVEMMVEQYYRYEDMAMTGKVTGAVLALTDDIAEAIAARSALRYEHSVRRNWNITNETLAVALSMDYGIGDEITIELDAQLTVLFRQVWLSGRLDGNAVQMLREFILREGNDFARKVVIWAVMLRCIRYYDMRLVEILTDCPMAEAVVAVVMIAMARQKRIDADSESLALFRRYLGNGENAERCAMVYNNVMRTFETQNIASEMREKIFPVVREQSMRFREESLKTRLFDENGLNPEWEERLEESGIMGKMRRINDLQLNGADIHYESFQMMKSSPFFMETAHWFYPFDTRCHQLKGMNGSDDGITGEIPKLLNLCDSDRYSLFLMLKGMGVGGLSEALKNLGLGNTDEVREQLGADDKWKETRRLSFATEARFAVMNLYRFYTLAPNHSDLISPFARIIPAEGSMLGFSIVPAGLRYDIANMLFKERQWDSAYRYFSTVADERVADDPMIYQKMGYCREREKMWEEAIEEYGKSDIIVPDDVWTIRHTAYCHREAGNYELAAAMYRKVLELDGDSVDATDALVDIYLEAGDYIDAKPLLFAMEYHRGSAADELRLGYCLFMTGDSEGALKYLDRATMKSGAGAREYVVRAICGGDGQRMREALAMADDVSSIERMLTEGEAGMMMERLGTEERKKRITTFNKILLEL